MYGCLLLEGNLEGCIYKYEIISHAGERLLKADPYGFYSELRLQTASVVYNLEGYQWNGQGWKRKKAKRNVVKDPAVIYEVHTGSWKKHPDGIFPNLQRVSR